MVRISTRGRSASLADFPGGGDPVQFRHPHVHHHDIGGALPGQPYRGAAVRGLARHLNVGLAAEDHGESGADQILVIDEQHPDRHAASLAVGRPAGGGPCRAADAAGSGSRALTSKPPPGRGPAWTVPPYITARSRIPASPWPLPPSGRTVPTSGPGRSAAGWAGAQRDRDRRRRRGRAGRPGRSRVSPRRPRRGGVLADVGERLLHDPVCGDGQPDG